MLDINAAIEAYSAAFGNKLSNLEAYCGEVEFTGDISEVARSIQAIQRAVFEEIWRRSETRPPSEDEMVAVTRDYLRTHEPWVNERGLRGLLQWIAWMSWHEGCVSFRSTHGS